MNVRELNLPGSWETKAMGLRASPYDHRITNSDINRRLWVSVPEGVFCEGLLLCVPEAIDNLVI